MYRAPRLRDMAELGLRTVAPAVRGPVLSTVPHRTFDLGSAAAIHLGQHPPDNWSVPKPAGQQGGADRRLTLLSFSNSLRVYIDDLRRETMRATLLCPDSRRRRPGRGSTPHGAAPTAVSCSAILANAGRKAISARPADSARDSELHSAPS